MAHRRATHVIQACTVDLQRFTQLLLTLLQVNLTILVLDVNDNAPVFQRRDYSITVPEDVAVGTEVLRVLATSVDIGLNAEITYRIRSGNELGRFSIDTNLGEQMRGGSRCASGLYIPSRRVCVF